MKELKAPETKKGKLSILEVIGKLLNAVNRGSLGDGSVAFPCAGQRTVQLWERPAFSEKYLTKR